ncbi:hypothetical protein PROFUN_07056 [Planoprotostelium fungivorum]|uniref:Uncharacterized protein n=1 Tax=Planoprotostelium fungivorum TaxID=1890364 RepID=A0A2P6NN73_9EUKA|nr:hypothetical protein PROFUN_07056 [Planoprotostelium fungivorum]
MRDAKKTPLSHLYASWSLRGPGDMESSSQNSMILRPDLGSVVSKGQIYLLFDWNFPSRGSYWTFLWSSADLRSPEKVDNGKFFDRVPNCLHGIPV